MRPFSHFQPILQLDLRWPLTLVYDLWPHEHIKVPIWFPYHINKPSLVPIWLQLFKWGHFHIFSLSYILTSDDLWPWYVIFHLINKWGFPCYIYDPTLVEIHYSLWKLEPNVNLFSQQTTDNKQQQRTKWSLCVLVGQLRPSIVHKMLKLWDFALSLIKA